MAMLLDDALYATAMTLFATLPLLSMHARSQQADASHLEPARVLAVAAFTLLLWLQARKAFVLGVAMVAINLFLRLLELLVYDRAAALLWAWTSQPRRPWRQSPKEAAVLFCVFGACGSSSMKLAKRLVDPATAGQSTATVILARVIAATLIYPLMLLIVGTAAGRHEFCARMLGRHCRAQYRKPGGQRDVDV